MNSQLNEDFLDDYRRLPDDVRELARKAYRLWKDKPTHRGLHFKRIHSREPIYSVRVGKGWRVLGLLEDDTMTWFWIGSHADYDTLIARL